jgi:outer membrane protein assembly factor BamE (lipoprotein component of BamABCDE complex)
LLINIGGWAHGAEYRRPDWRWWGAGRWGKIMQNRSHLAILLLLCSLLAACATAGNDSIADATGESVAASLHKGRTTQADVRKLYGDPMKTSFSSNGFETWEYEFTKMQSRPTNFIPYVNLVHSGADGEKKSLVIFFDKRKVVQDYTMSASKVEVSRGLITR